MNETDLVAFLRSHKYAVQSSVSSAGDIQSALVGVAFTDNLEIIFDTLAATRKATNLKVNSQISFVVGGWIPGDERTVQYQGIAGFPTGEELQRAKSVYFAAFPDGPARQSWPGITYVRCKPAWIRFTNFNASPAEVLEFVFALG